MPKRHLGGGGVKGGGEGRKVDGDDHPKHNHRPVLLPHDGTIHHYCHSCDGNDGSASSSSFYLSSLQQDAVRLVLDAKKRAVTNHDDNGNGNGNGSDHDNARSSSCSSSLAETSPSDVAQRLVASLIASPTQKDQLRILGEFRRWWKQRPKKMEEEEESVGHQWMAALLYVMMEWSVSKETASPLRNALRGALADLSSSAAVGTACVDSSRSNSDDYEPLPPPPRYSGNDGSSYSNSLLGRFAVEDKARSLIARSVYLGEMNSYCDEGEEEGGVKKEGEDRSTVNVDKSYVALTPATNRYWLDPMRTLTELVSGEMDSLRSRTLVFAEGGGGGGGSESTATAAAWSWRCVNRWAREMKRRLLWATDDDEAPLWIDAGNNTALKKKGVSSSVVTGTATATPTRTTTHAVSPATTAAILERAMDLSHLCGQLVLLDSVAHRQSRYTSSSFVSVCKDAIQDDVGAEEDSAAMASHNDEVPPRRRRGGGGGGGGVGGFGADSSSLREVQQLHWTLLTCPNLPLDNLLAVGIALVRVELHALDPCHQWSKLRHDHHHRRSSGIGSISQVECALRLLDRLRQDNKLKEGLEDEEAAISAAEAWDRSLCRFSGNSTDSGVCRRQRRCPMLLMALMNGIVACLPAPALFGTPLQPQQMVDIQRDAVSQLKGQAAPEAGVVVEDDDDDKATSFKEASSRGTLAEHLLGELCLFSKAPDVDVRYLALKSLRTLVTRCNLHSAEDRTGDSPTRIINLSRQGSDLPELSLSLPLLQELVLDVVLDAWENPAGCRKVESTLAPLFRQVMALGEPAASWSSMLESGSNELDSNGQVVRNRMLQRVLRQPKHSKGRYLALQAILLLDDSRSSSGASPPQSPPHRVAVARELFSAELCSDLLSGIGDGGHSSGAMADLFAALTRQLLSEMASEAGIDEFSLGLPSKEGRRSRSRETSGLTAYSSQVPVVTADAVSSGPDGSSSAYGQVLDAWLDLWVPIFVAALVSSGGDSRRAHVAAFCFPRIVVIGGGSIFKQEQAAMTVNRILQECDRQEHCPGLWTSNEELLDRLLWVRLHSASFAMRNGLLAPDKVLFVGQVQLQESIARTLAQEALAQALVHFLTPVRVAAFEAIESAVFCWTATSVDGAKDAKSCYHPLQVECDLWMQALPFTLKQDGKESTSAIVHQLLALLDRLSSECKSLTTSSTSLDEPLMLKFSSFLLHDLFTQKGCYPGTTYDKETFCLTLLEGVLVFLFRDHSVSRRSKLIPKAGSIFQRRRSGGEESVLSSIRLILLGEGVISTLVSLLHSTWDSTRSKSFALLRCFIIVGCQEGLQLPPVLEAGWNRRSHELRSVFLASSPRQRESSTGAFMLAILQRSSSDPEAVLRRMIDFLDARLSSMSAMLNVILDGTIDASSRGELPLAHGVVHAVRLMLGDTKVCEASLLLQVATLLCRALRLSLTVVADLRDTGFEGVDDDFALIDRNTRDEAKAVNPGAIGANGIFSSVLHTTKLEEARRMASQRIVVGAWLLTKESCNALSVLLVKRELQAEPSLFAESGSLLLDTLTTLKHAGAAYGSHKALQQVSEACMATSNPEIQQLPSRWMSRLLLEVSGSDRLVRNSILRRSTGYALGFVSLMRSEVSLRTTPRSLCSRALANLLRMALPPAGRMRLLLEAISYKNTDPRILFSFLRDNPAADLVEDEIYNSTSRVHALNILRAAFLDAPLAPEVFPFAGDAIAAAILGYLDPLWAVRNSATMVFSSVMLRVVDSDKNASNTDATVSRAVTLVELFRSYTSLPMFLRLILDGTVANRLSDFQPSQSLPAEFPILLLFCRVQPTLSAGAEAKSAVAPFFPSMVSSLGHRNVLVRRIAARALVNLSFGNDLDSPCSSRQLLLTCIGAARRVVDWNRVHGSLLTIHHMLLERTDLAQHAIIISELRGVLAEILRRPCCRTPPMCLSACLEIALLCEYEALDEAASRFQDCLEQRQGGKCGDAELAATVGSALTRSLCPRLWNLGLPEPQFDAALERQSAVLHSTDVDIRCAGIKAFKKELGSGLRGIRRVSDPTNATKRRIEAITGMLGRSLKTELLFMHSPEQAGAHKPTLRRISRCLIEATEALLDAPAADSTLRQKTQSELWDMAAALLEIEKADSDSDRTSMTGNAIELLGLALAGQDDAVPGRTAMLRALLDGVSHPGLSWRLRHSAASALRRSGLLSQLRLPDRERCDFFRIATVLSQDSDEDVRRTASQALFEAYARLGPGSSSGESSQGFLPVPEVLVQKFDRGSRSSAALLALQTAWDCTAGLEGSLQIELSELQSLTAAAASSHANDINGNNRVNGSPRHLAVLVNANSSDRKIFEQESVSTYCEPCLLVQSALLHSLEVLDACTPQEMGLDAPTSLPDVLDDRSLAGQLVGRCRSALSGLCGVYCRFEEPSSGASDRSDGPSVAPLWDLTAQANILPQLHSLFLACSVLYLPGWGPPFSGDVLDVREMAQNLLECTSAVQDSGSLPLHGLIRHALEALARPNMERIRRACFLLFHPGPPSTRVMNRPTCSS